METIQLDREVDGVQTDEIQIRYTPHRDAIMFAWEGVVRSAPESVPRQEWEIRTGSIRKVSTDPWTFIPVEEFGTDVKLTLTTGGTEAYDGDVTDTVLSVGQQAISENWNPFDEDVSPNELVARFDADGSGTIDTPLERDALKRAVRQNNVDLFDVVALIQQDLIE